jgi:benzil reductase ((S)-benzoin forming)
MTATTPFPLPDDLTGTVVVVTGASRGLGSTLAARFAERGASLGSCARHKPGIPDGATAERVVAASVDVADAAAVEAFADRVVETFGPIDLWVNNAGVLGPIAPARDADQTAVRDALLINIAGVMAGSAAFARRARTWPEGRRALVNVSSGAATSVYPGWSTYGPTKAAVDHFSRHLAAEEPDLIVHAVAPGVVDTDMQAQIRSSDEAAFPAIDRFRAMHDNGTWNDPVWIADHLLGILTGAWTPDDVVVRVPDAPR